MPSQEEIKEWWSRWKTANLGGPTGPLWGLALDIDPRHDGDLQVGGADRPIPDTVTSLTGGGGTHHLFRFPEEFPIKNHVGIFPGVDVRGIGGQIVLPPSVHVSGNTYHWEGGFEPGECSLAEVPGWLIQELKQSTGGQSKHAKATGSVFEGVSEGQRNDAAAKLAGRYFGRGLREEEVVDSLRSWNLRNNPPLEDTELQAVIRSIGSRHRAQQTDGIGVWAPQILLDPDEIRLARDLDTFSTRFVAYASQRTDAPLEFLEGAALVALSSAVGRKAELRLTTGSIHPNIWVMLVADSTRYRKSTAIELSSDVLSGADLSVFAPDDFSPQRFINLMAERSGRPTLFCRDEFGGFYEGLNKLEHQAGGKQVLIAMHDGRDYRKELVGLKMADKTTGKVSKIPEVIEVKDPFLSILAGTQRDLFLSQAQPGDIFSGFLPRFAFIVPTAPRERNNVTQLDPAIEAQRKALVEEIKTISGFETRKMRVQPGVLERWNHYGAQLEAEAEAAPLVSIAGPVFDRIGTMALKVAMLLGFCDGDTIAMTHLLVGMEVAERWRGQTFQLLSAIGPSRDEKIVQRILNVVTRKPGILRRDLMSSLRLSAKEMNDAHATLEQREAVIIVQQGRATSYHPHNGNACNA